ncbi:YozQ family protein [Aliibacillus thermotolerans]|uniref:YozQ family protein n=1 Tax=Aliibacillus thermotolerans TaxID=1834418 RepID=A0ABW0U5Q7_9BACI|nr:YozQ family protein [Aliibacillus thermotolerans]MDA3130022.1 DUF4025 domain-containing protein [Aliibacillus thermotolerans]
MTDRERDGKKIVHEQVSDTWTEGTIDGRIDRIDEHGSIISHKGTPLRKDEKERRT